MSKPLLSILLADDDNAMRRLLARQLETAGYLVRQANDGREAFESIQADCPDLLITDWEMPFMDGLELCRLVRQAQLPHYIHILMLTAKSNAGHLIQGLEAGADDFLAKPVCKGELLARLHAASRMVMLEKNLRELSEHDPLTGVLNRRTFRAHFWREWSCAARYAQPLSCVMLDLDYFKKVNDDGGHAVGDAALLAVADVLRRACRPTDFICRYGGEEFLVLLTNADERGAASWAERVRHVLSNTEIEVHGRSLRITASFGVAQKMTETVDPDSLIDAADQSLMVAKQSGRNRAVCYSALQAPVMDPLKITQRHPLDGVVALDIMSTLEVPLYHDDTVRQATEHLLYFQVGSVPVVDAHGMLVGIVSEKDLMTAAISEHGWQLPIAEVMKSNVVSYEAQSPAKEVFDFLCRVSIRRVVVVTAGRPIGVISRDSFLRWFCDQVAKAPALS